MGTALRGNRGKIVFASSGNVEQVQQWSIEESADTIETTAMDPTASDGAIPKTFIPGNTEWSGSLTAQVSRSDTDGQAAARAGAELALKLYPEADATGKKYWAGNSVITRYQEQGELNGKIIVQISFKGTGALTLSTA